MSQEIRILTTNEMDGLFTEEDIKNKDKVVLQCWSCKKWTTHDYVPLKMKLKPCIGCGQKKYDAKSMKSLRTYNALVDNKRKPK